MGLSDIAAGVEVTAEQVDRGVPTVDGTDEGLADRLRPHAEALPCTPAAAATVVEAYTGGTSVGATAHEAGVAPVTASKVLHRCGVSGVSPLGPAGRGIVRDWLDGELPRSEAMALVDAEEAEFALAVYVESHDPVPALEAAVEGSLAPARNASVTKRDALGETMSSPGSLR
jgi:hypothetical protein